MSCRSRLPALLLMAMLATCGCQYAAARPACRVNMPGGGQVERRQGDEIRFTLDDVEWQAAVDCAGGRLVEGRPLRPPRAREIMIPVDDTEYRLISADPRATMSEYRENGSHVRIDLGEIYYVAALSAWPGRAGQATVRYFMAGQAAEGLAPLYCYNRTQGEQHISLPLIGSLWTVEKPVQVSLACSGHGFILEVTTDVSPLILGRGPTPAPATPCPTLTPDALGHHSDWPLKN